MQHGGRVIPGVLALEQRLGHGGFPQIAFRIPFGDPGVDGLFKRTAHDMHILPDFGEHDGKAGILTNRRVLRSRDVGVQQKLTQHILAGRRGLPFHGRLDGPVHHIRQAAAGGDGQLRDGIRYG